MRGLKRASRCPAEQSLTLTSGYGCPSRNAVQGELGLDFGLAIESPRHGNSISGKDSGMNSAARISPNAAFIARVALLKVLIPAFVVLLGTRLFH